MFDAGLAELILIFVIGLLILGPERLPRVAAQIGRWVAKARRTANQLRYQLEREVALDEVHRAQKKKPQQKPGAPAAGTTASPPGSPASADAAHPVGASLSAAPPAADSPHGPPLSTEGPSTPPETGSTAAPAAPSAQPDATASSAGTEADANAPVRQSGSAR